jgi:hypothetical protein
MNYQIGDLLVETCEDSVNNGKETRNWTVIGIRFIKTNRQEYGKIIVLKDFSEEEIVNNGASSLDRSIKSGRLKYYPVKRANK